MRTALVALNHISLTCVIQTVVLFCIVSEILQVFCSTTDPQLFHPNFGMFPLTWTRSPMLRCINQN